MERDLVMVILFPVLPFKLDPRTTQLTTQIHFFCSVLCQCLSELSNGPCCITWPPPKCFVKQELAQEGEALQSLSAESDLIVSLK